MDSDCFVGIDVSKDTLQVFILPSGESLRFYNETCGRRDLAEYLTKLSPQLIVLEASGRYHVCAADELMARGLAVAVANPRSVRQFARAAGVLAKADEVDAKLLAQYAQKMQPRRYQSISPWRKRLRELVVRRDQLVRLRTAEKTRLAEAEQPWQRASHQRMIKHLSSEIQWVEGLIEELVNENEVLAQQMQLAQSVPGVGFITAAVVLAHMPELGLLTGKQAAALSGTAPWARDSGRRRGKRRIWGGRRRVREALYMAALVACRRHQRIGEMYQWLVQAGKPPKVAIVACMRKLVIWLNAVLRDRRPYKHPTPTT